jgi:photosystem II stability/assembly factor-like uncharacterized protein
MKKLRFISFFLILCFIGFYFVNKESAVSPANLEKLEKKLYPYEGYYLARQYPAVIPQIERRERALSQLKEDMLMGKRSTGEWETQGPGNLGARINSIAISPDGDNVMFIGYSNGGVWRTTDNADTWQSVWNHHEYGSVGSIKFHPDNSHTVFVGTGDPNIGGYYNIGNGLYRSDDLGETWHYSGLRETRIISSIAIAPTNPDIMYVGAMGQVWHDHPQSKGLFKSVNGGQTWQQVLSIDGMTGITEVILHPNNPDIVYASAWTRMRNHQVSMLNSDKAGVYKSTDGGQSWQKLENGLPDYSTSRVGIAMSPMNPEKLYCIVISAQTQNPEGLYVTENGGQSWQKIALSALGWLSSTGGFGWYFGKLAIHPNDDDMVFHLGVDLWSLDKKDPASFQLAAPVWNTYMVHADKHDLKFYNNTAYLATDGGLYKCNLNDLPTGWEKTENIPTTEFYRVGYNPHDPDFYSGGAQDNGTTGGNKSNINFWPRIMGGDGFQTAFWQSDPNVMFAESQNGNIRYRTSPQSIWRSATDGLEGSRHWDMQYIVSPHDDKIMYTATDRVYKSDAGLPPFWRPISEEIVDRSRESFIYQATTIDQSIIDADILYVGTSDGLVWASLDQGITWSHRTIGLPEMYVSSIKASPNIAENVYVTYSGYRDGIYTPRIYRSKDYGQSFESISSNLPDFAINDVYVYPFLSDEVLFAGTDGGVFYTRNAGVSWELLGHNMPIVSVMDLEYNPAYNQIVAATHGRSIMSFDLDQIGISQTSSTTESYSKNLSVFPNPASQSLVLKTSQRSEYKLLEIIDTRGRRVLVKNIEDTETLIDVSSLSSGVYFVKYGKYAGKLIVSR